jgi:hypothetical protein
MTDVDPNAEIQIRRDDESLLVVLPLTGPVSQHWVRRYTTLARAHDLNVSVRARAENGTITVKLPPDIGHAEVIAALDRARKLTAEVKAADRAAAETDAAIQEWWTHQRP